MSIKTLAFALALAFGIGMAAPAAFANQPSQAASQDGNSNAP